MEHETITACENICRDFSWLRFLQDWSPVFANAAVIFGVFVAYNQLTVWRSEHIAKRKAEVAQEVLAATYDVIRSLQSIRALLPVESRSVGDRSDAIWNEKWRRIKVHKEEFDRLLNAQVSLDALIGNSKASKAIKVLLDAPLKIGNALNILGPEMNGDEYPVEYDMVWAAGAGDTLSGEISDALETVKNELFPVIRMEKDKT